MADGNKYKVISPDGEDIGVMTEYVRAPLKDGIAKPFPRLAGGKPCYSFMHIVVPYGNDWQTDDDDEPQGKPRRSRKRSKK